MRFSIIIPVYNVERYLARCIDSVLGSGIAEYEILLVIGVSTDASNEICYEYAKKQENISVIRQDADGLSNARNCGLKAASGEFVVFLDSDDFVESRNFGRVLENVHSLGEAVDVYVSDYWWVNEKERIVKTIRQIDAQNTLHVGMDYLPVFLSGWRSFWSVWRYIYRREFLIRKKICFLEGYLSEDVDFTTKILLGKPKIVFCHLPYYCYRIRREGSLMNEVSYQRIHDAVVIFRRSIAKINADPDFAYKQLVVSKYLYDYLLETSAVYEVPDGEKKRMWKLFLNTCEMLDTDFFKPAKFVYQLSRFHLFPLFAYAMHILKCAKKRWNVLKGY